MSKSSTSLTMKFNGIEVSDAERLLAAIWRVFEEHTIATPLLDVRSANASIDIRLTFQSAEDLALVEKTTRALLHKEKAALDGQRRKITAWRMRAEELRTVADQFSAPSAQEPLRRSAANYEQMADYAETLLGGKPSPRGKTGD
jgi:hypothetical protein